MVLLKAAVGRERKETMKNATNAAEAYMQYEALLNTDSLVQSSWHSQAQDGRQLACALGALGEDVSSSRDCPAQIMPRWLAQMVPWFFDNQEFEDAKTWGLALYAELKRLDGQVPFSVVRDWQANVVGPLAVKTAEDQKRDTTSHQALVAMQKAAAGGQNFTADEWRPVLKAAFLDIYRFRYRTYADADAYAYAYAYADANAYADAYAYADADAYAYAYADADAYAYAYAYAYADAKYRARVTYLANGMVECLKRVEAN